MAVKCRRRWSQDGDTDTSCYHVKGATYSPEPCSSICVTPFPRKELLFLCHVEEGVSFHPTSGFGTTLTIIEPTRGDFMMLTDSHL